MPRGVCCRGGTLSCLASRARRVSHTVVITSPKVIGFNFISGICSRLRTHRGPMGASLCKAIRPSPALKRAVRVTHRVRRFRPSAIVTVNNNSTVSTTGVTHCVCRCSLRRRPNFLRDCRGIDRLFAHLRRGFISVHGEVIGFRRNARAGLFYVPAASNANSRIAPCTIVASSGARIGCPLASCRVAPRITVISPRFIVAIPGEAIT